MTRAHAILVVGGSAFAAFAVLTVLQALAASGSSARTAVARPTVRVTEGKPSEYAIRLATRQVPAGLVTFRVTNAGSLTHTFKICTGTHGRTANACIGRATAPIGPGKTATLTVRLKAGLHELMCTLHARLGMKGILRVTPGGVLGATTPVPTSSTPAPSSPPPTTSTTPSSPGGPSGTCSHPTSSTVNVSEFEWAFTVSPSTIPCGTITFVQKNTGTIVHNFDVNGSQGVMISPGQTTSMTVNFPPGQYHYQCDVGGHDGLGQNGWLTVTG
jgi:plastocyanin